MYRPNHLTDEELALDGIEQELRLLERLVADGLQLDAMQLQTLAEYRDRFSQFIAPSTDTTPAGKDVVQTPRTTSSHITQALEPRIGEPSIEDLRQSIRKLLDEAVA